MRGLIAMAVAICTGCGPARDVRASLGTASGECTQTLAKHCGGPCPSYAQVAEGIRKTSCRSVMRGFEPSIGHCPGVFDMTSQPGPYGGVTMYFDAQGRAIGALQNTDSSTFCNATSFTIRAGTLPACPGEVATEKPCASTTAGPSPAVTPGSH